MTTTDVEAQGVGGVPRHRPMRVLHWFGGRLAEGRGTPSRARHIVRFLGQRPGVDSFVLSGDRGTIPGLGGIDRVTLDGRNRGREALERSIGVFRPDLLFGHTHKALAPLGRLGPGNPPCLRVVDLHGDLASERLERPGRSWPRRWSGYLRARSDEWRHARSADAFTAASTPLARRAARFGRPVKVLWGGVDLELFRPQEAPPAHTNQGLHVGYAGNFRPYQGVTTLLDAFERLAAAGRTPRLTLLGDLGPFPEVERRARELVGDRLTCHGQVPYERVPAILGGVDALVIPRPRSRTATHGFPSKLAEYMALGRPVVATRVGDQAKLIEHGANGLLVSPDDASALAEALASLEDPSLRDRIGRAGRLFAEEHLSWDRQAAVLATFLEGLLAEAGDHGPGAGGTAETGR